MDERQIIVRGRPEPVPPDILNLEAWKKYRRGWVDYEANPNRYYTFENGKKVKLPYPGIEEYCKRENIHWRELKLAQKAANKWRATQGYLISMKKIAYVPPGVSVGFVKSSTYLVQENETLMLELFGRFFNPRQVHKKLLDNNIKVHYDTVLKFFNQNREKIRELRNKAQENIDDLSIGIKRGRLEILDFLLGDLKELYNNQAPAQKLNYSKEIRGIIEQARKEVEGDELKLTINGRIDVNTSIEVAMKNSSMLLDFTLVQMVMSRVAARTGVPYMRLVTRLANSFYSKFNGFRKNDNLEETPIYPSSFNYDIFEMRSVVEKLYQIEDSSYTVVEEELPESQVEELQVDKTKLLELLRGRMNELEDNKKKL
jgi:hypothetical protein